MLHRRPARVLGLYSLLVKLRQLRRLLFHHSAHALGKHLFDIQQMREHLADGPAVRRRLPLQDVVRSRVQKFFQDNGRLLEKQNPRQRLFGLRGLHSSLRVSDVSPFIPQSCAEVKAAAALLECGGSTPPKLACLPFPVLLYKFPERHDPRRKGVAPGFSPATSRRKGVARHASLT